MADTALGADCTLALTYAPARKREPLRALFTIDAAMGDVVKSTSEPMVGQIRLAWWRERLEELGAGDSVAREPRLQAAEHELISRGIKGSELARIERGWVSLFDPFPWEAGTAEAIWFRGRLLFALAAHVLDRTDDAIEGAGGLWALVDAARHCSDAMSREMLVRQAKTFARGLEGTRFSARLRPLSMLAALATRDLAKWPAVEPEGTPGRALTMLRHRLTGRL